MVCPFKQPSKSLTKIQPHQLIAQLKAGQRYNACGIALTNNGKNDPYKIKQRRGSRKRIIKIIESQLNLNITAAILSRSLGVFHNESVESHRFTNVESFTVCSLDYLKGKMCFKNFIVFKS